MLFPGNRNQQHAAACIFFELKWANGMVPNMAYIESKYNVTRRILQRARAKLARLGLIEHVSHLNSRYGGQEGWKLSNRMSGALRTFADKIEVWQKDGRLERREKDERLPASRMSIHELTPVASWSSR